MPLHIDALDLSKGDKDRYAITRHPDECPVCRKGIDPIFWVAQELPSESKLQGIYRCPRSSCHSPFIAYFKKNDRGYYTPRRRAPLNHERREFGDIIEDVSSDFVEIYNQAARAESDGLDEVAGVGYRKSVEYLIKDYLIDKIPSEKETIRQKFLGSCIDDHLEDEALRNCARLATWLGNDETHYEQRWDNKDIEDLKNLIDLTVNSIRAAKMRADYEDDMLESGDESG